MSSDAFTANILSDPVVFCEEILHFSAFPYQASFLRDNNERIVVCAGRQVGKSFMTSARAIWFATTHAKTTTLIVSATLRQSMLMFDKILDFVEGAPLVRKSVVKQSRTRIKFKNGSWIIALPCGRTGYSLRGFTAHQIIMDEAAFMPSEVISEVVLPMISTTHGTAILLSTPFDREGMFFKAFSNPNWSKYHFPSSVNPMITPEFLEEQRSLVGELEYQQEYLAEFVDDQKAYFPMALLRQCVHVCGDVGKCEYCESYGVKFSGELYGGYDPGGRTDPAAFVVLKKVKENFEVVLTKTFLSRSKTDENLYTRFTVELADLHKKFHFKKIMVDQTGLGQPIIEHCKDIGLPSEGLILTARSKEAMLSNLRLLFENKKLTLPPNDLSLLANLNCIEEERTRGGGYTFNHAQGTHDDLAYALALAAQAANKGTGNVIIMKS